MPKVNKIFWTPPHPDEILQTALHCSTAHSTRVDRPLRDKGAGEPPRGRGYSPRMEHAIDYKSVLDCGIHQDWTPDS